MFKQQTMSDQFGEVLESIFGNQIYFNKDDAFYVSFMNSFSLILHELNSCNISIVKNYEELSTEFQCDCRLILTEFDDKAIYVKLIENEPIIEINLKFEKLLEISYERSKEIIILLLSIGKKHDCNVDIVTKIISDFSFPPNKDTNSDQIYSEISSIKFKIFNPFYINIDDCLNSDIHPFTQSSIDINFENEIEEFY